MNCTILHLNEAKELFILKQLIDPFSAYSYIDFIRLMIWEIDKIKVEEAEKNNFEN